MRIKVWSRIWLVFLAIAVAGCEAPPPQKGAAMELFYKANTVYKSGDHDAALKLYEDVVATGYVSAAVYYNMGNCFMKKNNIGRAILWYERALRINPRDTDLLANLQYAKSLIKSPEVPKKFHLADYIFHLQFITDDEIVMILCFLLSGISALILIGLSLYWRFQKALVLVTILIVIFIFHFFAFFAKLASYNNQAIVLTTTEAKYEPAEKATTHFAVFEGWKVRMIKDGSEWAKIERPDGLTGWVRRKLLEWI